MTKPSYKTPVKSSRTNDTESIFFYERKDDALVSGFKSRKVDSTTGRVKQSIGGLWMVTVYDPKN